MRLTETPGDRHSDAGMPAVTLLLDRDLGLGGTRCACPGPTFVTDRHGPSAANRAISDLRGESACSS